DPIPLARKILSSVARVGQRFGVAHVTNVLRGHTSEQVLARRHHELSTFGLLKDAPAAEIRGYIEQLIAYRLLRQTEDAYPVLTLTPTGLALMKDPASEPDLTLARQRVWERVGERTRERARGSKRAHIETESWDGVDRALFDRLRAVRLEIAR